MKHNYNPYTVPENFFPDTCNQAMSKYLARKRALGYGATAVLIALLLFAVPAIVRNADNRVMDKEVNTLASMYDYDIFLQVNF